MFITVLKWLKLYGSSPLHARVRSMQDTGKKSMYIVQYTMHVDLAGMYNCCKKVLGRLHTMIARLNSTTESIL